jgi:hypothetical protein
MFATYAGIYNVSLARSRALRAQAWMLATDNTRSQLAARYGVLTLERVLADASRPHEPVISADCASSKILMEHCGRHRCDDSDHLVFRGSG